MSDIKSYNQAGQELWVRDYFNNKKHGFFVDVGAYDGVESSNTYFLEKDLMWDGLCIESNPAFFSTLQSTRGCSSTNVAVMPFEGHCVFQGINTYIVDNAKNYPNSVECMTINSILEKFNAPSQIDYISLDIEGHELSLLETLDFDRWNIELFTIEHNLYLIGPGYKNKIFTLMSSKGYTRAFEDIKAPEGPYEDWYIKNKS